MGTSPTMKLLVLLCLCILHTSYGGVRNREDPIPKTDFETSEEMDNDDELSEDDFEAQFGEDPITDPEEKKRREEKLQEEEEMVKEENKEFMEGKKEWYDKIDEYSDLPEDEFEAERTGDSDSSKYARGLLHPKVIPVDEESERYFDSVRYSRADAPATYSSVDKGYVTEVKNQKQCGSCVAFSNMAAIEVCFKKLTGAEGDYSEQQLVDCGYNQNGASGCNGAYTYSYLKTVADSELDLTHESTYPYLNTNPKLTCPADDDLLKKLVAEHGAAVTSVRAAGEFGNYAGGIF